MKRVLYFLLITFLIPGSVVFARGGDGGGASGGGDRGGNGGGFDGGGDRGGSAGSNNGGSVDDHSSVRSSGNGGGGRVTSSSTGRNFGSYTNRYNLFRNRNFGGNRQAYVSPQLRQMGVSRVPMTNRSQLLGSNQMRSRVSPPGRGPDGAALKAAPMARTNMNTALVRTQMSSIARNREFTSQVNTLNGTENRVGHYYWHNFNGGNFCHYYDHWGCNWYGWYFGGAFFWTQYYWGNWWWWDPFYDRWCYWYDGWWWWQDPYHVNTVYIYNDGDYVPAGADNSGINAVESAGGSIFRSNDGSRMVKISGNSRDAFLYDTAKKPAFSPIYLASGVKEVKFSNASNGRPLQVMLILNDGSFDLFDDGGNPYNGGSAGK
jgi:hypothetical protein